MIEIVGAAPASSMVQPAFRSHLIRRHTPTASVTSPHPPGCVERVCGARRSADVEGPARSAARPARADSRCCRSVEARRQRWRRGRQGSASSLKLTSLTGVALSPLKVKSTPHILPIDSVPDTERHPPSRTVSVEPALCVQDWSGQASPAEDQSIDSHEETASADKGKL